MALCNKPEYADYFQKAPCDWAGFTSEQLTNRAKITASEKIVASKFRIEERALMAELLAIIQQIEDATDTKGNSHEARLAAFADATFKQLYEGRISYGQYNTKRQAFMAKNDNES